MIEKFKKSRSWFFEKGKQNWQTLAGLRKKWVKTQITKIGNERRDITTDTTEIHRIIKDYYEQLCANKLDEFIQKNG